MIDQNQKSYEKFKIKVKNLKARDCPGGCGGRFIPTRLSPKMCKTCLFRKIDAKNMCQNGNMQK